MPRLADKEPTADVSIERDLTYGPAPRNRLDVFAAAGMPRLKPVLLFVHGGGFVAGDKKLNPGSPFFDNIALWAVRHDMVGINMTYRLAPGDPWPAGAQDVARAVDWARRNVAARGGDPERIYLFGHSVGAAHVAAYLAHPEFHAAPGKEVAGALLLSGVYQITPEVVKQSPGYLGYFGDDPGRYAWQSSLEGLAAGAVPLWLGVAELDPPNFLAQARMLRDRLRGAGRSFSDVVIAGHNHLSSAYSIDSDDASVGDEILKFVRPSGR